MAANEEATQVETPEVKVSSVTKTKYPSDKPAKCVFVSDGVYKYTDEEGNDII